MLGKPRQGYILLREQNENDLICDPASGGVLVFPKFEEAEAWAKKLANESGEVLLIEPVDVVFLTKN